MASGKTWIAIPGSAGSLSSRSIRDSTVLMSSTAAPTNNAFTPGITEVAWGGIASLQFGFAAVWQEAARRGIPLSTVIEWMSRGPAELAGLEHKGRIEIGADADLVALADAETFIVTEDVIKHRHPITPYLGAELRGVVRARWLRGTELTDDMVAGRLLTHDTFRE